MNRLAVAVWSGLWLAVLLTVPPWVLLAVFGPPLPHHPPQPAYLHEWITVGAALLLWMVWLGLLASVALQVRAALRRLRMPPLRLANPPQGLLSGVVGAAVVAFTTAGSRGTLTTAPPAPAHPAAQSLPAVPADSAATAARAAPRESRNDDDDQPDTRGQAGVQLPDGGWIPSDTASAIGVAAGVLWVRRRRRYLPGTPSPLRVDPDLTGFPETVAAVLAATPNAAALERQADTESGPALHGVVAVLGRDPAGPLRLADLAPGGLGLTGPGAADAARGILTAALLSGDPVTAEPDTQVLSTVADAAALLDPDRVGAAQPGGLSLFPTVEELLAAVESHLLYRSHLLTAEPDQHQPRLPPAGTLLLLTTSPTDQHLARRLAMALTHTAGRGRIHAVLLGAWRYGHTWNIEPDGTSRPEAPAGGCAGRSGRTGPRLCVLSRTTATDLLTLLRQAHHRHDDEPAADDLLPPSPAPPTNRPPDEGVSATPAWHSRRRMTSGSTSNLCPGDNSRLVAS